MRWLKRPPAAEPQPGDLRQRVLFAWWPRESRTAWHWLEWVRVVEELLLTGDPDFDGYRWVAIDSETWTNPRGRVYRVLPPLQRPGPRHPGKLTP